MLAPALILVAGFVLFPAANALWLSLTETNLLNTSRQKFIGFHNFQVAFTSDTFWISLLNLLMWVVGCVAGQLVLGMIGAILLNQKLRGRAVIRGAVLVPWATASILVSLMWLWMLNPNFGIINHFLQMVGLLSGPKDWLGDPATALPTLILIDVWQGVPFFAVMLLAALQSVPKELLEAAKIDGAGPLRFFWDTLLPLSRTNMAALFVILFILGWNQYLWPLLITTRDDMQTIQIGIRKMITTTDALTEWPIVMATAVLAMLPPVLVVVAMQKLFVRGLIETEK